MASSPPPSGASSARSVAATWGKKGVTAKQRQAAARAARLDPLPAGEYDRQQTLLNLDGGGVTSLYSRRSSGMDPESEQQFVRRHLGTEAQQGDDEADMKPSSPLLNKQPSSRSVQSFWSDATIPPPSFDAAAKPATSLISRPARSRQRLGDDALSPLSPSSRDQTGEVAHVLQGLRARQEAAGGDAPEEDGADMQSAPEQPRPLPLDVSSRPPTRESMREDGAAGHPSAHSAVEAAPSQQPAEASPGARSSCFSSLSSLLFRWMGGDGKEAALAEMRQGVILPQDGAQVNVRAVEAQLNRLPEACVLNVRVRRTDELVAHSAITHPMVKLHILDLRTGAYWRKKDPMRHAVSPYENLRHGDGAAAADQPGTSSILPIMTHPYSLKSSGSFLPRWDENLLINEPLRHVLDVHAMLFFEVLDFGPAVDLNAHPTGFFPIAWGFLKPLSSRGEPNLGVNQQLQLYRYTNLGADRDSASLTLQGAHSRATFHKAGVPQVYYEWIWQKHTGRCRYPATFFIDLSGVAVPHREKVRGQRPTLPTQIEEGRMDFPELMASVAPPDEFSGLDASTAAGRRARKNAVDQMSAAQRAAIVRRRKPIEECLIPNHLVHEISAGLSGCFVLRYSPDGRTLAAACGDGLMFTIKLYDSDSGAQLFTFTGHHDLIYDLSWNCLGTELVSASSDATAKVWAVDATRSLPAHQLRPNAVATLQHTGFVYSCAFHPKLGDKGVILTGGFDGALRFWTNRGELLHVVQDHQAHINSIVLSPNGTRFFTGDSEGIVKVWEDTHYTRATGSAEAAPALSWPARVRCLHTITHEDLRGTPVTCIRYHPRPERLVVYCRDNCLYVFSLLRYDLRQVLSGIPCQQHSLRCAISPDGDKLVAGGEDGQAYFWDLSNNNTSGEIAKIMDVGFHTPLYDVSWHPAQHAVAFASFGGDYPIRVFEFNAAKAARSVEEADLAASARGGTLRPGLRDSLPLPPLHSNTSGRPPLSGRAPLAAAASLRRAPAAVDEEASSRGLEATGAGGGDRLASSKRVHFTPQ